MSDSDDQAPKAVPSDGEEEGEQDKGSVSTSAKKKKLLKKQGSFKKSGSFKLKKKGSLKKISIKNKVEGGDEKSDEEGEKKAEKEDDEQTEGADKKPKKKVAKKKGSGKKGKKEAHEKDAKQHSYVETGGARPKKLPLGVVALILEGEPHDFPPSEISAFMEKLKAQALYDKFYDTLVKQARDPPSTRHKLGYWHKKSAAAVVCDLKEQFAAKGISIHACALEDPLRVTAVTDYYKWVEFVDSALNPDYVPAEAIGDDAKCSIM